MTFTFKMPVQIFLHTLFSSVKTSTYRLIVVPSTAKMVCSLTSALFFTLIKSHQINLTFVISVKTMAYLKSFPCKNASINISFCHLFILVATFTNTFVTNNYSSICYFVVYYI